MHAAMINDDRHPLQSCRPSSKRRQTPMDAVVTPSPPQWSRTAIIAVISAAFIVTVSMGARQSFGLLMQPIGHDIGISRAGFGFAIALQNLLFGLAQPFVGALADRFGTRRTLVVGA